MPRAFRGRHECRVHSKGERKLDFLTQGISDYNCTIINTLHDLRICFSASHPKAHALKHYIYIRNRNQNNYVLSY